MSDQVVFDDDYFENKITSYPLLYCKHCEKMTKHRRQMVKGKVIITCKVCGKVSDGSMRKI